MQWYTILPGALGYKGKEPLIYNSSVPLHVGQVVSIALKQKQILGIVLRKLARPTFPTKSIDLPYDTLQPLPLPVLDLIEWMRSYYPGGLGAITQLFLPHHFLKGGEADSLVLQKGLPSKTIVPPLTQEQSSILRSIKHPGPYLLHGNTGTGKTRVYVELARRVIAKGKSVLVLCPEINLTSQLAKDFIDVFDKKVIIIHSRLSESERRKSWIHILQSKEPVVVLGPRSALFSPIATLGLIVVDEAHENTFKQEQSPHYHAVRVASKLGQLHKALFLIGSATPSIEDYFLAEQKNVPILRMRKLAKNNEIVAPDTTLVDLTDHQSLSKYSHISKILLSTVEAALQRHEQVLLFLNRRGTARSILCENCGWRAVCPRCDLPLIYHGDLHVIQCHTCGYSEAGLTNCPVCHKQNIIFKGIGTKAIADLFQKIFPQAKVLRFDTDTKQPDSFTQHYEAIKHGDIDILVGTQMLAKGLDLPKLSVVGVIVAETNLYFPDYTSNAQMYQLLSQVIGRVGRGHRDGKAIVQTYSPKNPVIQAVLERDWQHFYRAELAEREKFLFPPFCYLLKIMCRRSTHAAAQHAMVQFAQVLGILGLKIQIFGPMASFHERIGGQYQWQLVIKARKREQLLKVIEHVPPHWAYDIDPVNLL